MIALFLIIILLGIVVLVSGLAGRLVRIPAPACTQTCRQGRDCSCGTAMEQQP